MSDITADGENSVTEVAESTEDKNMFKPLVPDAISTLRRLMLNSRNEKIQRETAESVLDRAGATKKQETREKPSVVISDSQINVMLQAAQEVTNER